MKNNIILSWDDIFSRIEYIKKKHKIDKKTTKMCVFQGQRQCV